MPGCSWRIVQPPVQLRSQLQGDQEKSLSMHWFFSLQTLRHQDVVGIWEGLYPINMTFLKWPPPPYFSLAHSLHCNTAEKLCSYVFSPFKRGTLTPAEVQKKRGGQMVEKGLLWFLFSGWGRGGTVAEPGLGDGRSSALSQLCDAFKFLYPSWPQSPLCKMRGPSQP